MDTTRKTVDAVIAYVDSSDANWQKDLFTYAKIENENIQRSRFRSYNTLKYLVDCIKKNMLFVDKIYIIVAKTTQVPENLIDNADVEFVLHEQIIPECILPVFNSQAIEPFIHRIPQLKEHFIYFNDDMFPLKSLDYSDFYDDEKPVWDITYRKLSEIRNSFRHVSMHSYLMAAQSLIDNTDIDINSIMFPDHTISPMFKSDCDEVFDKNVDEIISCTTRFRKPWNVNQYLFTDYSILKRGYSQRHIDAFQYLTLGSLQFENENFLREIPAKIVCVNDVDVYDDAQFETSIYILHKMFDKLLNQ